MIFIAPALAEAAGVHESVWVVYLKTLTLFLSQRFDLPESQVSDAPRASGAEPYGVVLQ